MAVQFSLSYDANGDPVLVENTVTGTRQVISSSSVVSPYKSRFETPNDGSGDTPDTPDTPEEGSDIYRYINEMENNADNNLNLSFVDKQNLGRYTPEAIEARGKPKTRTQEVMETVALAMLPYGKAAMSVVKALGKILPQESEEIKAIKQFYADPQQAALVESIPGMSDYNLVYGNPLDPSYGLAPAAGRRQDTILGTLSGKYRMSATDIAAIKAGTYTGITPINPATGKPTKLIDRYNNLGEVVNRETKQRDNFVPKKSQSSVTNQESQETAAYDSPSTPKAPDRQTPNQDQDRFSDQPDGSGGYSGGYESSTDNYNDPYSDDTE